MAKVRDSNKENIPTNAMERAQSRCEKRHCICSENEHLLESKIRKIGRSSRVKSDESSQKSEKATRRYVETRLKVLSERINNIQYDVRHLRQEAREHKQQSEGEIREAMQKLDSKYKRAERTLCQ